MEMEERQLIKQALAAMERWADVLSEVRDRLPEAPSHHREPTVDPRYEVLRGELLLLADEMIASTPTVYAGQAVQKKILAILAKVAP